MKTLTEFSTLMLRKAAEAKAAAAGAEGDALTEAVATTMSVQPDRAARLLEALDIVGDVESVRLVRVFQGETGPHGSVSRGEFHYAVDRVAAAKPRRRDDRGDRGDRRGGGGGGGGGGRGGPGGAGGRDKPRGLGSLKIGAVKDTKDEDDRPGRGETPRAGIGWQLTAAPREMREGGGRGRGGPRRGPGGPGGPRGDRRGPGGPGGERRGFGPGGGGGGDRRPEGRGRGPGPGGDRPRFDRGPRPERPPGEPTDPSLQLSLDPNQPVLEGQQPAGDRKPRRPRKPIGPDANGMGPDGQPWDPDRRRKRLEERQAAVNAQPSAPVEAPVAPAPVQEAPKE